MRGRIDAMRIGVLGIALCVLVACDSPVSGTRDTTSALAQRSQAGGDERVISLDYCADQFVLRFVDPDAIAAVSQDARQYFSYMRHAHPHIPGVPATAENVLALAPTRVVRSYGGGPGATAFFTRAGIDVVQLSYPSTLSEVRDNILRVTRDLGYAAEGERQVREFDRRLRELAEAEADRPVALYTTPGGVTTGPGSLVHELLTAAGLTNYETRPGWRDLPLEQLVFEPPERLANATFGDPATHVDPWTRSRHPRVRDLLSDTPGVTLEGAWTSCGAWFLVDAVEALAKLHDPVTGDRGE